MRNYLYNIKEKGFTIIETLVAISILVSAVVGTMSAVQSGLSSHIFSKDQIIAFYLAQEGFEQIRNIRDENRLNGEHWLEGIAEDINDPCYFGKICRVSPVETTDLTTCSGSCPKLGQSNTTGFYGYNSLWPETVYKREISLTEINDHEVAVTVTMTWSKGVVTREFRARENLFNW